MAGVRYVGTATWTRVLVKDDGTLDRMVAVKPGDVVDDLDSGTADKLSDPSVPRGLRNFVVANSHEDPYRDDYEEPYNESSNAQATDNPKLDMGSTRPGGDPQFVLSPAEEENLKRRQAASKSNEKVAAVNTTTNTANTTPATGKAAEVTTPDPNKK